MKIRPTNKHSSIGGGVKHLRLDDDYTLSASDFTNANYLLITSVNNIASGPSYNEAFTVVVPIHTAWDKKFLLHCTTGSAGTSYMITHDRYNQSGRDMGSTNDYVFYYAGPDGHNDDAPILLSQRRTSGGGGL